MHVCWGVSLVSVVQSVPCQCTNDMYFPFFAKSLTDSTKIGMLTSMVFIIQNKYFFIASWSKLNTRSQPCGSRHGVWFRVRLVHCRTRHRRIITCFKIAWNVFILFRSCWIPLSLGVVLLVRYFSFDKIFQAFQWIYFFPK